MVPEDSYGNDFRCVEGEIPIFAPRKSGWFSKEFPDEAEAQHRLDYSPFVGNFNGYDRVAGHFPLSAG